MQTQIIDTKGNVAGSALPVVRGSRQKRLLSEAITLEEESIPGFLRLMLLAAAGLVILFIVWSAIVPIDEVATAPGEVVPSAAVKLIQHLEGGVVGEIKVRDDQLVEAGDVLVRMDPAQPTAELEQLRSRQAALLVRAQRITAFLQGGKLDFAGIGTAYPDLASDQRQILENQIRTRKTNLEMASSQIDQRQKELGQLRDALAVAKKHVDLANELMRVREEMVAKGLVTRIVYLETKRALITAEGEVERLREQIRVAADQLNETRTRYTNLDSTIREQSLDEQGAVTAELAQVRNAIAKAQDRVDRLEVRAPVTGWVQDLKVRTVGEVIPPGGTLMRLVPKGDTLEAEIRIATRDVGHMHVGQRAVIKVTTYEYARYGSIPGTLKRISPTTFVDTGSPQPYYKGEVELARPYVGQVDGLYPVLPGMSLQVEMVTGNKTLLAYLMKPFANALDASFHER